MRWLKKRLRKLHRSAFAVKWLQNLSAVKHLEGWIEQAAATLPPGAKVLDAGSGPAPFRKLFDKVTYETADHLKNSYEYFPPTYACDLTAIPVEGARFDRIICTQVLEHVPDPVAVLKELSRTLKEDGDIWLSAPFFFEEHEGPYDFFRYTQWGFRKVAEDAGLEVKEITWLEGYHATLAHQLALAAGALSPSHIQRVARWYELAPLHILVFGLRLQFGLLARMFTKLDARIPDMEHGMCMNYKMILKKRKPVSPDSLLPGQFKA
jgi:SAM-dependent methyltransferase